MKFPKVIVCTKCQDLAISPKKYIIGCQFYSVTKACKSCDDINYCVRRLVVPSEYTKATCINCAGGENANHNG